MKRKKLFPGDASCRKSLSDRYRMNILRQPCQERPVAPSAGEKNGQQLKLKTTLANLLCEAGLTIDNGINATKRRLQVAAVAWLCVSKLESIRSR